MQYDTSAADHKEEKLRSGAHETDTTSRWTSVHTHMSPRNQTQVGNMVNALLGQRHLGWLGNALRTEVSDKDACAQESVTNLEGHKSCSDQPQESEVCPASTLECAADCHHRGHCLGGDAQ